MHPILNKLRNFCYSYWQLHLLCSILVLIACAGILWHEFLPTGLQSLCSNYAGLIIIFSISISALFELAIIISKCLKLNNYEAFLRFITWIGIWVGGCFSIFALMSYLCDMPATVINHSQQLISEPSESRIHQPDDILRGNFAMSILIDSDNTEDIKLHSASQLCALESEHPRILKSYLSKSPRWSNPPSDNFYAERGHVVFIPQSSGKERVQGVHAAFRYLSEGEAMPKGYIAVKPGQDFPSPASGAGSNSAYIPDLALDLGGDSFLLLAWRGLGTGQEAKRAINAAIAEIDNSLIPLKESPNRKGIKLMLQSKNNYLGQQVELRLSEPPSQFGCYQAEIYCNTGESGSLTLIIKEKISDRTLRIFSFPAQHSGEEKETFRHEIPQSRPTGISNARWRQLSGKIDNKLPLFNILEGQLHHPFVAEFELWFTPSDYSKPKQLLLTKLYQVQTCAPDATKSAEKPRANTH